MKLLGEIFLFLTAKGEKPRLFGGYHIISLLITAAVTVYLCKKFKDKEESSVRRLLLVLSLAVILLEIYKQLAYSLTFDGEKFSFSYKWHIFPWQFCSTPMYAGLAAALIKNRRIHYCLCAYLATFGLFAGAVTLVFPVAALSTVIGINVQSAVCHGIITAVGIFLFYSGYVRAEHRTVLYALPVFLCTALTAMILNETVYRSGILGDQVFNMFFISPYFPEDLPIFIPLRKIFPGKLFGIFYVAAFTGISYLVSVFFMLIRRKNCNK